MHILHIIESLEFGGAEKIVVHLANRLCKNEKVSVCLTKRKGELLDSLDKDIDVYFLDAGEGNSLKTPKILSKILVEKKVDVLHSHDWGVYLEAALAVRKCSKVKLIHTVHGRYTEYRKGARSRLKLILRHFLERRAQKYTSNVISVSNSIRDYIISDIGFKAEKVRTIHNGIAGLNGTEKQLIDITENGPIKLVSVGRIAVVKNFPLLINAFNLALKTIDNIELKIVGDGPEMHALSAMVKELELTSQIKLLGFQKNIDYHVSQSDIFILSSDYEGISIAALEAMSLGVPIIATNVGGMPEMVIEGQTGSLVPKGSVKKLAAAIIALAQSPENIYRFGLSGKKHFENNFHENVVIEQYKEVYQS